MKRKLLVCGNYNRIQAIPFFCSEQVICACVKVEGGLILIRRGLGLTVIVDHADITDDELVGIACYCCFDIVTDQKGGLMLF